MTIRDDERPDVPAGKLPALGRFLLATESDAVRKKLVWALAAICALLFISDLIHHRHGKFPVEEWTGFYAVAGFASFAFIIFATKGLKRLLSRDETYYGEGAVDGEDYPREQIDVKDVRDA